MDKRPGYIYGEDKNYFQESEDSARMLGIVMLAMLVAAFFCFGFAVGAAIF